MAECEDAQLFSEAPDAAGRELLAVTWALQLEGFPASLGAWTPPPTPWLWPCHSRTKENSNSGEIFEGQSQGGQPKCVCSQRRAFCPLPGCRAKDTSWGDRELEVGMWALIILRNLALLQRRIEDAER